MATHSSRPLRVAIASSKLSANADRATTQAIAHVVTRLAPRWFVVRDAQSNGLGLLQPHWAMSTLRGPMTRTELKLALAKHARVIGAGKHFVNEVTQTAQSKAVAVANEPAECAYQSAGSGRLQAAQTGRGRAGAHG